ncbi:PDZ domain-containing protein [Gilvimarinus sp. F26214L]|uniref:PDZ domain-containing protein n=1 Tax=Gilvimarinus sp. DZF01 TaxID=3461371 RepID=UPI0040465038
MAIWHWGLEDQFASNEAVTEQSNDALAPGASGDPPAEVADSQTAGSDVADGQRADITVEQEPAPPPVMSEEEARRHRRMIALNQAAQNRFDETVAMDKIDPAQIQPAVRNLFNSLTLEPHFDVEQGREGFVSGMRIAELSARNPLAEAGFQAGDRLVRFDGQPLEDPSQIAHLFASLGESFEVCAERETGEYCRIINLPKS